jgi:hypothetical protein
MLVLIPKSFATITNRSLGRPEIHHMTRASLDALHDHALLEDTMSSEMTSEVARAVEMRGGDLLMRHHDQHLVVEIAFEKQAAVTRVETFPRAIRPVAQKL